MAAAVQPGIARQGVAQPDAQRLIDRRRPLIATGHICLHRPQPLRQGITAESKARPLRQADHTLLGEVAGAAAHVAGPVVPGRLGGHVHRHEGQLVEPAGDAEVLIHETARLAGAHGDAQHAALLQRHGAGEGGHVAVVHHPTRDGAEGVPHRPEIEVPAVGLKLIRRHLEKQAGTSRAVADLDPRRGNAHPVHPGEMLRRALQRRHHLPVVIAQVTVVLGRPEDLLGIDHPSLPYGRRLAVAAAGVEADAAALQPGTHRPGLAVGRRKLRRPLHTERPVIGLGHERRVKGPGAARAVVVPEPGPHRLVGGDHPAAAPDPEQGLHQAVDIEPVRRRGGAVDAGAAYRRLRAALHGDAHVPVRRGQEGPAKLLHGVEIRIQRRNTLPGRRDAETLHPLTSRRFLLL